MPNPAALETASNITQSTFKAFDPSRCPGYVVAAACVGSLWAALFHDSNRLSSDEFYILYFPATVILLTTMVTSYYLPARFHLKQEEYLSQIRFSRSFGISSAVLCLLFCAKAWDDDNYYFGLFVYVAAIVQILVLAGYAIVRMVSKNEHKRPDYNYGQVALCKNACLIGLTALLYSQDSSISKDKGTYYPFMHAFVAIAIGWGVALMNWVLLLTRIQKGAIILNRKGEVIDECASPT